MNKTAYIRARIEPALKSSAEHVLHELGITPSQAVTMLYSQISQTESWPIELKIPNKETRKVFEETDRGEGLIEVDNVDDMFDDLDS